MLRQLSGSLGSAITGACCLGFVPLLAGLSAIGAGFLINDLFLIPLFTLALAFTVWSLLRSRRRHGHDGPLRLGIGSALAAFAALWFLAPVAYAALAALIGANVWDLMVSRRAHHGDVSTKRRALPER